MELLVGMQAQNPQDPYYALWSRLEEFDPHDLSGMIERREALRGALMRATLHMSTTPDFLFLRSHLQETLAAVLGSTSFAKDTVGMDRAVLLDQGRSLLEEHPMTRADLARALEEKWPEVPGNSMAQVVTYLLPVIQVPPRGLWGRAGAATWTTVESWIGKGLPKVRDYELIVMRYLAVFGPATISDIRVWSRLNGLRQVVDGMRDRLRSLQGEDGSELLDHPDAPILDEDTPAPPRFLPEYDNVAPRAFRPLPILHTRDRAPGLGRQPPRRRRVQRMVEDRPRRQDIPARGASPAQGPPLPSQGCRGGGRALATLRRARRRTS